MIKLRLGKSTKTGIGGKKRWNGSSESKGLKKSPFKPRFTQIRKVSKKQAKRNKTLKEKFAVICTEQVKLYGSTTCEVGRHLWSRGIPANCAGMLVVDHVGTRNQDNADRYENLQVVCFFHNSVKGSVRKDYRTKEMIEVMKDLDEKCN